MAGSGRPDAAHRRRRAALGQDRGVSGGPGDAALARRDSREEDRAAGPEGRGEPLQLHAVFLRRRREQAGGAHGYLGSVVQEVSGEGEAGPGILEGLRIVMMEVLVVFVILKLQNLLLCVSFLDELGNWEMAFVGFFLYVRWFISILYLLD